jgi:hypothetical protein
VRNIETGTLRQFDDLKGAPLASAQGFGAMNAIEQCRRPIVIMTQGHLVASCQDHA